MSGSAICEVCYLAELYLEDCKARIKPYNISWERTHLSQAHYSILWRTENKRHHCHYRKTVADEDDKRSRKLQKTYLKSINNQLSAVLNYACKYYGLKENPVHVCGSMGKKKETDKRDFWTFDEFQRFIAAVSDKSRQRKRSSIFLY